MDHSASGDQDFVFDLESGISVIHIDPTENRPETDRDEKLTKTDVNKVSQKSNVNPKKTPSAKKPPRPPKGFSLDDVYDRKLITEFAKLAIIRRARIERMKALKQKKNSKILSSSSSNSSFFAMVFTIIFFLVILLQGRNSGETLQASPQKAQTYGNDVIVPSDLISLNYKS